MVEVNQTKVDHIHSNQLSIPPYPVTDLAGFREPGKDKDKETTREDQEDLSKVKGSRATCYKRTSDESSKEFKD
jgi:hypothetical protein